MKTKITINGGRRMNKKKIKLLLSFMRGFVRGIAKKPDNICYIVGGFVYSDCDYPLVKWNSEAWNTIREMGTEPEKRYVTDALVDHNYDCPLVKWDGNAYEL